MDHITYQGTTWEALRISCPTKHQKDQIDFRDALKLSANENSMRTTFPTKELTGKEKKIVSTFCSTKLEDVQFAITVHLENSL